MPALIVKLNWHYLCHLYIDKYSFKVFIPAVLHIPPEGAPFFVGRTLCSRSVTVQGWNTPADYYLWKALSHILWATWNRFFSFNAVFRTKEKYTFVFDSAWKYYEEKGKRYLLCEPSFTAGCLFPLVPPLCSWAPSSPMSPALLGDPPPALLGLWGHSSAQTQQAMVTHIFPGLSQAQQRVKKLWEISLWAVERTKKTETRLNLNWGPHSSAKPFGFLINWGLVSQSVIRGFRESFRQICKGRSTKDVFSVALST